MAHHQEARGPRKHHAPAPAAEIARVEPGREHMAVHTRKLAVKQDLPILRADRRPLLRGLEQAHRPALDNHVHRPPNMGL